MMKLPAMDVVLSSVVDVFQRTVDGFQKTESRSRYATVAAVVVSYGAFSLYRYVTKRNRRRKWEDVPKDVVLVHALPKGRLAPNVSPFVLKLETYLRLAKIPYQLDFDEPLGPKGKSPWVTWNGEDIADSQVIIERLGRHYGKDFTSKLTAEQQAAARSLTLMVTEHLCWGLRVWRHELDQGRAVIQSMANVPLYMRLGMPLFRWKIMRDLRVQGMGKHSPEEVGDMVKKDLAAISLYLGEKPFLMGKEPSEVDCTVFGFLAQLKWNYPGSPYETMLEADFPNLTGFVLRMKERLWPDWDRCLDYPETL
ncbi:failed axon connections homolog [Penaeus japonicus]|uniref:failed axon connections homolog n=1 Tax=Penaeus japonicus TaxID=27405 RepID=UPI001C70D856|nr:failed axon connections homolog [Penaeus japonicus]